MTDVLARTWTFITAMASATLPEQGQAGDGREKALLKYVLENAENNPESVLKTIDKYAQKSWLMNIGDLKGLILEKSLISANPKTVLELGAYVGYSATLIASKLEPGGKLISLEMSELNASITRQVVDRAGLSDKVDVVTGILSEKIEEVRKLLVELGRKQFDFVFIDHDKNYYLSDFLILKEHGLVGKGTILFADNMRIPGSPKYREYMNTHADEYDTVETKTSFEYLTWLPDSVLVTTCK
ncbi:unnamed protein product [Calypogeia fissa]